MERFVAGEVVVIAFPYSDLKTFKPRPAVVLAQGGFGDVIVCQITSFNDASLNTVALTKSSFSTGSLPIKSFARPDKIFTADQKLITKRVATLSKKTLSSLKQQLAELFGLVGQ